MLNISLAVKVISGDFVYVVTQLEGASVCQLGGNVTQCPSFQNKNYKYNYKNIGCGSPPGCLSFRFIISDVLA